ncbi:Oxysterol-binding protein-related protein 11 [Acropora cervicornis]|uniref:Oxysterol-binding protein-related protein 11 n=1 Tax=Acropora cervicornis TaxID=6130 RepID=A0AAD9QW83_ACRCE|nr:Oxysterol-binding protein-related protein 11 [Acropora cervicornis]
MAVAEDILNDPYFADLDIDLSQFSEQEKSVIIGVMQKAKNLDQQDDDKYSKWTNLMKGWQFRWFTLDPESGLLEYYVDKEKKKLGPRGSVYLGGSIISPSDEDSFTFTVSAANGDIFKLRASDAKERQDWINKLRSVAEFHASSIGQAAPPLYKTSSFSVPTPQPSAMVKQPASVALATGPSATVTAENMKCDSPRPQRKIVQVSENVLSGLTQVREDLWIQLEKSHFYPSHLRPSARFTTVFQFYKDRPLIFKPKCQVKIGGPKTEIQTLFRKSNVVLACGEHL